MDNEGDTRNASKMKNSFRSNFAARQAKAFLMEKKNVQREAQKAQDAERQKQLSAEGQQKKEGEEGNESAGNLKRKKGILKRKNSTIGKK